MRLFHLHNEAQTHSQRLNYSETTNKNACRQAHTHTHTHTHIQKEKCQIPVWLTLKLKLFYDKEKQKSKGLPLCPRLPDDVIARSAGELRWPERVKTRESRSIFHMILTNKSPVRLVWVVSDDSLSKLIKYFWAGVPERLLGIAVSFFFMGKLIKTEPEKAVEEDGHQTLILYS